MHLAQRTFAALFSEDLPRLGIEIVTQLLASLSASSLNAGRVVNQWVAGLDDERLFHPIITPCLIRARLLAPHRLDLALYKAFVQRSQRALEFFGESLDEILSMNPALLRTQIARALEALVSWVQEDPDLELGQAILKRASITPASATEALAQGTTDDHFEAIFESWVSLSRPETSPKPIAKFIQQLHQQKILKDPEAVATFLRSCLELCIATYESDLLAQMSHSPNFELSFDAAYLNVDALAALIVALVIYQGEADGAVKSNKVAYLDSLLSVTIFIQAHHHRSRGEQANTKVFFRLYSTILVELSKVADNYLAGYKNEAYQAVARALMALQPAYFPGFAFAWGALVTHRLLLPHMLNETSGWAAYSNILETLLTYTGETVKSQEVLAANHLFARSTLRILLVLHHDFPDFLADYHMKLVNALPSHCVQMRNLILSATPSTFADLPDPFENNLKVDRIDDIRKAPEIRGEVLEGLKESGINKLLEDMLHSIDGSPDAITKLCAVLSTPSSKEISSEYLPITVNVPLINSVVLVIGMHAVNTAKGNFNNLGPSVKLLYTALTELNLEARYFFIGAMADQLRFPNSHTYFFSRALHEMFGQYGGDERSDEIKEQIVRVLIERLLTHRPHPWGLVVTLVELYKNPNYQFADMHFVKSAPDVSCIRPPQVSVKLTISPD